MLTKGTVIHEEVFVYSYFNFETMSGERRRTLGFAVMLFRYSIDFRWGIAVFANFLRGIAVLITPRCSPLKAYHAR